MSVQGFKMCFILGTSLLHLQDIKGIFAFIWQQRDKVKMGGKRERSMTCSKNPKVEMDTGDMAVMWHVLKPLGTKALLLSYSLQIIESSKKQLITYSMIN